MVVMPVNKYAVLIDLKSFKNNHKKKCQCIVDNEPDLVLPCLVLQHYSGLEEAVFRNITACKEFSKTLKTAYGPQGRNKMVINHLEKLFVTNDAATIIKELEVSDCH